MYVNVQSPRLKDLITMQTKIKKTTKNNNKKTTKKKQVYQSWINTLCLRVPSKIIPTSIPFFYNMLFNN